VQWRRNPVAVLDEFYGYLRLEDHPGVTPEEKIWAHDQELLGDGLAFYRELEERLGTPRPWPELAALLDSAPPPQGIAAPLWREARAAHRGHQLGLDLLKLPVVLGDAAGFFALRVDERLEPVVPEELWDERRSAAALAALAPPPPASANHVLAWTGGTFYARPSPGAPPYVSEGRHLEAGDTVGLLEVMKMFNPLRVDFACTVTQVRIPPDGGCVVAKGQVLFDVAPDSPPAARDEDALRAARAARTREMMARV
jgi:biotin carboxyl carrier protein